MIITFIFKLIITIYIGVSIGVCVYINRPFLDQIFQKASRKEKLLIRLPLVNILIILIHLLKKIN